MAAEAWFERAISVELSRLAALQLPGTPPDAQTAAACRAVWVDALWGGRMWREEDKERIEAAFAHLTRNVTRWPAPAHFLEVLPERKPLPALSRPSPSREERECVRKMIADLAAKLKLQ